MHLRYCRTPSNLPTHCDDRGAKFSIAHVLKCKKEGLVIQRHDEIQSELQDLAARALIPSEVTNLHRSYCGADVEETEGMTSPTEQRGDLLVRNLWKHQTGCIMDVRITNLDTPSNLHRKAEAVLLSHEHEKKKKIPPNLLPGPTPSLPLPLWFHVMECLEMKPRYSSATKPCKKQISRMSIAIERATHLCIRRSRIPNMS